MVKIRSGGGGMDTLRLIHRNPEGFIKTNFPLASSFEFRRKDRLDKTEGREYGKERIKWLQKRRFRRIKQAKRAEVVE